MHLRSSDIRHGFTDFIRLDLHSKFCVNYQPMNVIPTYPSSNHSTIAANTEVRIHIPNVLNPISGGTLSDVHLRAVSNTNNVF
jgi:hypothetical protein